MASTNNPSECNLSKTTSLVEGANGRDLALRLFISSWNHRWFKCSNDFYRYVECSSNISAAVNDMANLFPKVSKLYKSVVRIDYAKFWIIGDCWPLSKFPENGRLWLNLWIYTKSGLKLQKNPNQFHMTS